MNIVIGKPLVKVEELYGGGEQIIYTEERFLPRILVEYKVFKSTGEVKRNRPDLFIELNEPDFKHIKIGKKHLWVTVGK